MMAWPIFVTKTYLGVNDGLADFTEEVDPGFQSDLIHPDANTAILQALYNEKRYYYRDAITNLSD